MLCFRMVRDVFYKDTLQLPIGSRWFDMNPRGGVRYQYREFVHHTPVTLYTSNAKCLKSSVRGPAELR
jgi:hypothetical protein